MIVLVAAMAAGDGISPILRERCDTIELNHCYNNNGAIGFDQLIFWKEGKANGQVFRYPGGFVILRRPIRITRHGGCYRATWMHEKTVTKDGKPIIGVFAVDSDRFIETWTIGDPEVAGRVEPFEFNNRWQAF